MTEKRSDALEFAVDFMTGSVVPKHLGRIYFGDGDACVSLILKPDGLHAYIRGGKKFIHIADEFEGVTEFSGVGP